MSELLRSNIGLCTGCNRCVRECPMETANVTYLDEGGNIKVEIDHSKCITCGWCISACKHKVRYFEDDTERFFDDLSKGAPISLMAAPAIRTNIPDYKKLFTYLKRLGVNNIYDVSLGADICIWGHVKYIERNMPLPIITQPCPVIVTYLAIYRHDLLPRLSPVHGPMGCTSVYMKKYQGINDRIAALSPCIAKANEFKDAGIADYNVTFKKLIEYLTKNNINLPDEKTPFDHDESGLGSLLPMPGGLKENIEYFTGNKLHIAKAEGFSVYKKLDEYARTPEEFLPDIYDVLNCHDGCNIGPAALRERNVFDIDKTMNARRKKATEERKRDYYESVYKKYDATFDFSHFLRKYRPIATNSLQITTEDIRKAFVLLGKADYDKQHIDCGACGNGTCYGMARKIALGVNIPENCIIKSKEDAKTEHDMNMRAHEQIAKMEKIHEADERMRIMLDTTPYGTHFWNKDYKMIDCNQAALNLFRLSNKQELINDFINTLSPKYQPNGRLSVELAVQYLKKTFEEGYFHAEWMHQTSDGEPLPCDIILVRVDCRDDQIVASYTRDLREHKKMMSDIERRGKILSVINRVASVLLAETNEEHFEKSLLDGMEIIGQSMEADCVQIWQNETRDDELYFTLKHKWLSDAGKEAPPIEIGTAIPYSRRWIELFLCGECVNGPVANLPQEDQDMLRPLCLMSTLTLPLYYQDKFWGVFCVDDIVKERYFTQDEVDMLYSATLMLVNAINHYLQESQIRSTAAKLNMAIQASKVGLWEMEIAKDDPAKPKCIFKWSNELRTMLGYKDETDFPNRLNSLSELLHPDDKDRTLDIFAKHQLDTTGKTTCDVECRLLKKDGEYSYYNAAGLSVRDKNGSLVRVLGTMVDITETKNIILDSERQRIEAEAANKAKSNFLSTMSHEIRTPMNAIIGMTAIGKLSNDVIKKDDALKKIEGASKHLLGIINDILDMSKIEADKFELSHGSFDFEKTLQIIADVVNLRMDERRQKFFVHIDKDIPDALIGDDQRLTQVITNLLSNAIKFTPEEGTIRLVSKLISEENGICRLQISVEDTGIGVTDEQKSRLFKSFEQAESSTTRKYGGTGLGLAITKRIVELMDGEIWIESEPGKGSKFIFTFLVKRGPKAERRLLDERVDWENIRVFVVDDEPETSELFMAVSEDLGISCTVAANGADAARMLDEDDNYNIYFIDWKLLGINMIEFARKVKANSAQKSIVTIYSSVDWNTIEDEAREAGVNMFISKPLFPSVIADVVNMCVNAKIEADADDETEHTDDFTGYSILLADDVEINREIVLSMLEPTGLTVDCAENGIQAFKMFGAAPDKYNMIFMDIQMPEMDGYEATRQIRALGSVQAKNVPIIAMTANVFLDDIDKSIAVGMNGHIGKPIDFSEVLKELRYYLR